METGNVIERTCKLRDLRRLVVRFPDRRQTTSCILSSGNSRPRTLPGLDSQRVTNAIPHQIRTGSVGQIGPFLFGA